MRGSTRAGLPGPSITAKLKKAAISCKKIVKSVFMIFPAIDCLGLELSRKYDRLEINETTHSANYVLMKMTNAYLGVATRFSSLAGTNENDTGAAAKGF